MATEMAIGTLSDIPPGEGREFTVGGIVVTVFHTRAGEVFATQPNCPHKQGPLRDGLVDDGSVMCPLHDRIYDFRTGRGLGNACSIAVYPARLGADGTLYVTPEPASEAVAA